MTWRKLRREERQLAFLWGVLVASAFLLRPLWLVLAAFLPKCAFRSLTGIPCPTCGSTHAALAALHGHPLQALTANPLVALAGAAFVLGGLIAPLWAGVNLPIPATPRPWPLWFRITLGAVILANWAYLIVWRKPI
ncbi:MAG: DUF2752 domain-containing protein [Acidobacteria bacterium]|nr:DUF2752 domain-containing protein [Acidobacteriota bacterium]